MIQRTPPVNGPRDLWPVPHHVYLEAQELRPPSVEGGQSPQESGGEGQRERHGHLRLRYNKERLEFLTALSTSITQLHQDSEAWRDYLAELEEWDKTVRDGLGEDESPRESA